MSIKLWAFQDANGGVRVTPNDPGSVLSAAPYNRQKAVATAPGGFSMRDLRRHFESTEATLSASGAEVYIEFELEDLSPATLAALMTPQAAE